MTNEEQIKLLNKIQRLIDINHFYAIRIDSDVITLQGEFDQDLMIHLAKWFKFESDDGAIRSNTRNHLKIVFL